MTVFFAALAVFGIVITMMAVGVISGRKPIAGSCGGLAGLGLKGECEICRGDRGKCDRAG